MWSKLQFSFSGKRVFVTGHTGFKGAWLTQTLHLLGAEIMGYSLAPVYSNNLYDLLHLDNKCQSIIADIKNAHFLKKKIHDFQPDFIFHLAAQPLVRASYVDPVDTYTTNIMGTINLLEAIRHMSSPTVGIMITTDKVYENLEEGKPFLETDKLGGFDPYSSSKACCEIAIASYINSFMNLNQFDSHQKAIASCRAGNVIGGGDWAKDRLLPDIIRALKKKETIKIRNPFALRPWQHVMEPIFFYLLLAQKIKDNPIAFASAYNIGPNDMDTLTVQEVVQQSIKIWNSGNYEIIQRPNELHEAGVLKLDCTKAKTKLGWNPQMNVEEALKKTIEWYKLNHVNSEKSEKTTVCQIKEYADHLGKLK